MGDATQFSTLTRDFTVDVRPGPELAAPRPIKDAATWAQGYAVGTRVRVQVGLSAGHLGEIADVYADAHRPPIAPYRWYAVRLPDGLRPLYRHDEITPVS